MKKLLTLLLTLALIFSLTACQSAKKDKTDTMTDVDNNIWNNSIEQEGFPTYDCLLFFETLEELKDYINSPEKHHTHKKLDVDGYIDVSPIAPPLPPDNIYLQDERIYEFQYRQKYNMYIKVSSRSRGGSETLDNLRNNDKSKNRIYDNVEEVIIPLKENKYDRKGEYFYLETDIAVCRILADVEGNVKDVVIYYDTHSIGIYSTKDRFDELHEWTQNFFKSFETTEGALEKIALIADCLPEK